MERMTPLLETADLTIGHHGKPLIQGINLQLRSGEILCLLGPNGAGKTTLFRTLMGLIPALNGQITLAGQSLVSLSRMRIASYLAHVPQSLATPFAFSALDVVLMGAATGLGPFARPGPKEHTRAMAALEQLGIADLAEAEVTRLSGGQRQLILIARALAQNAAAIIMDEPTASLDFANRLQVNAAIRWLAAQGTAIILSTHDPDQAAELGDQAVLLNRGGIIATGETDEVLTAENLSNLYGITVRCNPGVDGRLHFY